MSKIREAFEAHCKTYAQPLDTHRSGDVYTNCETAIAWHDFKAGYQAAIAAVRWDGPVMLINKKKDCEWIRMPVFESSTAPLYHIPKDLL